MVRYVGFPLLVLFGCDIPLVLAFKVLHWEWVSSRNVPLALYGSAFGIIVGFRNNSAYASWWEARQIWGQIINCSRNLARQVCAAIDQGEEQVRCSERSFLTRLRSYTHFASNYVGWIRSPS